MKRMEVALGELRKLQPERDDVVKFLEETENIPANAVVVLMPNHISLAH